jgi:heat-inducible transcriptional repressor
MDELTGRQREVLKFIVQQYVDTMHPVASKRITHELLPQYSSATIRNDMAELERLGLITHLHTSAGRIPTDRGYRFFVESLMEVPDLPLTEQMLIRHQFHQVALQLEQWTRLAAAVMARMAGLAAVVTAPQLRQTRLKHVELIAVQETLVLIVVVTQAGTVKQTLVAVDEAVAQEQLRTLSDALNARFHDQTADQMLAESQVQAGAELEATIVREMVGLLRGASASTLSDWIYYDGLVNVLRAPEFSAQHERAQRMVELLRSGAFVAALLPYTARPGEVQVIIGSENPTDELRECAVVLARYGVGADLTGLLGVIGPTRMPYERSISVVRFMAGLMSDLLMDLYSA